MAQAHHPVRFALAAALLLASTAHAQNTGDMWEIDTTVRMQGMNIGPNKTTQCMPKVQDERSAPGDKDCKVERYSVSGGKSSFAMRCPDGRIEGETSGNYASGSMVGKAKVTSKDGVIDMAYTYRRISQNSCDPDGMLKSAAAQQNAAMAQSCGELLIGLKKEREVMTDGQIGMFFSGKGPTTLKGVQSTVHVTSSCSPAQRNDYCGHAKALAETVGRKGGFTRLRSAGTQGGGDAGWGTSAQLCGFTAPSDTQACSIAENDAAGINTEFLRRNCKGQFDALVKRECLGRRSTNDIAPKYRGFCNGVAGGVNEDTASEDGKKKEEPTNPVKEVGNVLKGLFGR